MSRTAALKASYVDTSIGEQIVKTGNYTAVLKDALRKTHNLGPSVFGIHSYVETIGLATSLTD